MRTYLVSYDLANPAMNEPYITDAIMVLGEAWARPLANVWYLRTDTDQSLIENRLARLLDEHDGLLVQGVREDAAFRSPDVGYWIAAGGIFLCLILYVLLVKREDHVPQIEKSVSHDS